MGRRVLAFAALLVTLVTPVVVVAAEPASAATFSAPSVIGLNGRPEVLAARGTAEGSYLTMTSFVADGTANATRQRWTFEQIVYSTGVGWVYMIRNVATGLCMTPNAHFGIYLQPCNLSKAWVLQDTGVVAGTGYWLRSFTGGRVGECLDADSRGSDAANVITTSCFPSNSTGERWRVRPGKDVCSTVDVTAVCNSFTPPAIGAFGNWRQFETSFAGGKNASVVQYVGGRTVNGQLADTVVDWFEIGWRSMYSLGNGTTPPTIADEAYWYESAPGYALAHSLSGAPYGSAGDGRNHTYMALGSSTGKIDLLYDYNTVGTTTRSEGSRISYVETGITKRDEGTAVLPSGIQHRVQQQDPNGVWHRFPAATTARVNDRQCYGPSTMQSSAPPNCINVTTTTVAGTGGVAELDNVAFTQPAAKAPARSNFRYDGPAVLSGVDQRGLEACMQDTPSACLQTVPGLAECVAARLQCHAGSSAAEKAAAISGAQAEAATRTEILTKNGRSLPAGVKLAVRPVNNEGTIVVTGNATVYGSRHDRTGLREYHGFAVTYRASTGAFVEACLGTGCENR